MITIETLSPLLLVSVVDRARMMIEPRPVVYAWTIPLRPMMKPAVGKSGPGISRMSCLSFSPRESGARSLAKLASSPTSV